ncbi:MAG: monovalent cation:proton antiporter family protein [Candidatus Promineifilaceae bacterium]|jgi:Kef-type K+ transport system membrane component KefB/Trk K+ transport system NAD-binding subunit
METDILSALLIITGLAAMIPVLSNRLERIGIPIVVYEIVAGMIVGVSGFNLIEPSPVLTFLAEFGFAYLMFLSGLELDFRLLNPTGRTGEGERKWTRPLQLGLLIFLCTLLLAFAATTWFAPPSASNNPFLLGLILSTTSLGVVVPVLKERDLTGSRFGQYLLVASSIADFATLILLTTVIAIMRRGLTLDLLLIPTLLLIFILAARFSLRAAEGTRLQRALNSISSATSQIRVRGAFALMVAWVVLAEAFGVEVILGAFLAGAIAGLVSGSEDHGEQGKLDAIGYGFFIPIFFIMVGARFDLRVVLSSTAGLLLLLWLIVVAFVVKMAPALLLRFQFTWRQTLGGGMLLSSRLSLIIAASAIALSLGSISETVNSDIILLAIITVTIAPLLFSRIYPPEEAHLRNGIIIVGQDQLAEYIIERLRRDDESITVICPDESRIRRFRELGAVIVDGCERYEDALAEAGAAQARVLLDLTSGARETLEVCRLAKESYGIPVVITRISDVELIPHLQEIGVRVVQPELATAMALEGAIRYPTAFDVLAHEAQEIDVAEVSVTNSRFNGVPLGEIRLPGEPLILSLQRGSTVMVPHRDTVVRLQDRLGLIGSPVAVEEAVAILKG